MSLQDFENDRWIINPWLVSPQTWRLSMVRSV